MLTAEGWPFSSFSHARDVSTSLVRASEAFENIDRISGVGFTPIRVPHSLVCISTNQIPQLLQILAASYTTASCRLHAGNDGEGLKTGVHVP